MYLNSITSVSFIPIIKASFITLYHNIHSLLAFIVYNVCDFKIKKFLNVSNFYVHNWCNFDVHNLSDIF